ncbi:MAG: hypothetical protein PHV34_19435 [Verrucomicrobiae bacterium]|nr:hypothetical protein [Verrucomicrobiae bacterium]
MNERRTNSSPGAFNRLKDEQSKGNGNGQLPPVLSKAESGGGVSKPEKSNIWLWVAGLGGGLVLLVFMGLLFVGAGVFIYLNQTAGGSAADDEIRSASRDQSDGRIWQGYVTALQKRGKEGVSPALAAGKQGVFSWWQRKFSMPSETAVTAALMRRLPANLKLVEMKPVELKKNGEKYSVTYLVTVRAQSSEYLLPVGDLKFAANTPKEFSKYAKYMVLSNELLPGKVYLVEEKSPVLREGETAQFSWMVRQVEKKDKVWRVLDAEPIPFQHAAAFESRWMEKTDGVGVAFLRSQEDVDSLMAQQQKRFRYFHDRIKRIQEQTNAFRQERMAGVPREPQKDNSKFGGSGSGEPTKTGMRVGGGAASGAAIGAMAGGGEGAGWGALGGLIVGGIYDAISKSNDKKKFEAQKRKAYEDAKASRAAALRNAERETANYERRLWGDFESEIKEEARQQEERLRAKG